MAFTGTAVQEKVSDRVMRITGLSLAASAVGTIGLFGGSGDVSLEDGFNPSAYGDVDLAEACEVSIHQVDAGTAAMRVSVSKTASPFVATLTNHDATNATPGLEIYVRFH